jgi:acetyltransferase-like isoleucine patch superfamily enzyme
MNFYNRSVGYFYRKIFSPIYSVLLRLRGVSVGRDVVFFGIPNISYIKPGKITIGNEVVLCSDGRFTALGVSKPVILRTISDHARINICDRVGLSGTTIVSYTSVEIGEECMLGADVTIFDTDFHPIAPSDRRSAKLNLAKSKQITIGRNVFVGYRSVIMKGVAIGSNSVISAGTIITKDVDENTVVSSGEQVVKRNL